MRRTETIIIPTSRYTGLTKHIDNATWELSYVFGYREPRFSAPAIPLQVVWHNESLGYKDMIYIDSLQHGEDDPMMRCCWDFHYPSDPWYGRYQATYTDAEIDAGWGASDISYGYYG